MRFSRRVQSLRLVLQSLDARERVTEAQVPAALSFELRNLPAGQFELLVTNTLGALLARKLVTVPQFMPVEIDFPEESSAAPPVSYKRLTHKSPKQSTRLAQMGAKEFVAGHAQAARVNWERSLEIDPENFDALEGLVQLHLRAHEFSAAAGYCARALAIDPANPALLVNHALSLYELGQPAPALDQARTALRWSPLMGKAHLLAALSLLKLGRDELTEVRRHLEQAQPEVPSAAAILNKLQDVVP